MKDQYAGTEQPIEHQTGAPELLKAILLKNPSAFKGPARNQQWKQQLPQIPGHNVNSTFNQTSPASYGQGSPGYTRHTPQGSPAQPASARLAVPEDKTRPPQSSPSTGFHDPTLIPQRASVIADPQSRVPELNRPFQDLCENKLNRVDVPMQPVSEWDDKVGRRLKPHSEHSFDLDSVDHSQRVGLTHSEIADYNRPEIHPSHRNSEGLPSNASAINAIGNNASTGQISNMRNYRPQKSQGQLQSAQELYSNSVDVSSALHPGNYSLISYPLKVTTKFITHFMLNGLFQFSLQFSILNYISLKDFAEKYNFDNMNLLNKTPGTTKHLIFEYSIFRSISSAG